MLNLPLQVGKAYRLNNGLKVIIHTIEPEECKHHGLVGGHLYNNQEELLGEYWFDREGKDAYFGIEDTDYDILEEW